MKIISRALAAALVALALAACGVNSAATDGPDDDHFDVRGSLTLVGEGTTSGDPCKGSGGYSDINAGVAVTVYNNKSEAIGLGELDPGTTMGQGYAPDCEFPFTVKDVEIQDTDIYAIEISHRGKITFKKSEAGDLSFTLGD